MNIIILGAPGSGKGTLARNLEKEYNIPHISTGEIFRENIEHKTNLGLKAKETIKKGEFVSDEITIEIVKSRLAQNDCKNGYILDGFPRNIIQAEALKTFAKIDRVIFLDVPQEVILKRIMGRRICSLCRQVYNTDLYAKNKCECGAKLVQREDDNLESVINRIKIYETTTAPLINFYKNILLRIEGKDTPERILNSVKFELSKVK